MFKEIFDGLMKDKFAKIALWVLFIIYFALAFANFIAPYSKDFSNRSLAYAPPSKIFTIDENGKFSRPYTYNYKRSFDETNFNIYQLDRSQKHYLKFFARGEDGKFHLVTVDKGGQLF